jgi:glycosyltransferase involved in cell wall biosynthesis
MQMIQLGIVIPCYNEAEVLPETVSRVVALLSRMVALGKISDASRIFFVDDGSSDKTWVLIEQYSALDSHVSGIKLSRNRGHQNALVAGLFTASGDVLVSIDADLQDDIDAIELMVDKHLAGADVVYGVRNRRESDTAFKRLTAEGFYKLMALLGAESVYNHADFRLLSRRVIECLKQYAEVNLYLRGIVPLIGFKSEIVHYDRADRYAGESKYPLSRMISLALDGITSFSTVPLRIITGAGFVIFTGSMLVSLWALWISLFTNRAIPGWTSVVLPMYFLGGIQIFCLGVLGEYLGKTYIEVKARPRFMVERVTSEVECASHRAIRPVANPASISAQ